MQRQYFIVVGMVYLYQEKVWTEREKTVVVGLLRIHSLSYE